MNIYDYPDIYGQVATCPYHCNPSGQVATCPYAFFGNIKEATILVVRINKMINKECTVVKPHILNQ
jgi:hypothetical protein